MERYLWAGESPIQARLRRFPPFLAHFPCCLTVFPANYPALLRARATWQLASAPAPRNDLGCSEDSRASLPAGLPPRHTRILQREGQEHCQPRRSPLPAQLCQLPGHRPAAPELGFTVTSARPPALPPCRREPWKSFSRSFPPRFHGSTALSQVWLHPRASCAMEKGLSHTAPAWRASEGARAGCGVLSGAAWGVAALPLSHPVFPGVGRGGAERRDTLKLSGVAAPGSTRWNSSRDGRELSAGTRLPGSSRGWRQGWLAPERDRVQLRSWAVTGHAWGRAGHPLLW